MKRVISFVLVLMIVFGLAELSMTMGQKPEEPGQVEKTLQTQETVNIDKSTTTELPVEVYVSKVIIEGKWGNGEGEFGMRTELDPIQKPREFYVDKQGDIYILDEVNSRVQKFNSQGKLEQVIEGEKDELYGAQMIVDSKGNLYVFTQPGIYQKKARSKGNRLELICKRDTIRKDKNFNFEPNFPERLTIFILDEFDNWYVIDGNTGKTYKIKNLENFDIELFSEDRILKGKYISKSISHKSGKDRYSINKDENIDTILIQNIKGKKLNEIFVRPPEKFRDNFSKYDSFVSLIDSQDNIYSYVTGRLTNPSTKFSSVVFKYIYKYDFNGDLLAQIDLDNAPKVFGFEKSYFSISRITGNGEIYQLICSEKKGLVVVKFERQK